MGFAVTAVAWKGAAVLGGFAIMVAATTASAQNIQPPTDPAGKAAFAVLEKNCSRCHQQGRLVERERPAGSFGNILHLDELANNRKLIIPGNPFGSFLFKQIVDKQMPYDVMIEGADKPAPDEADIKVLEAWIQSLGTQTASCDVTRFVDNEALVGLIAGDLEKLPRTRRSATRYLTLTNLTNICTDAEAMKVYRQGTIKLINSLSRSSDPVRLDTIDPDASIIRINLDDIRWDARDWDTVLSLYPYNVQPDTELAKVLEGSTGTKLPYVRADWFAFTASRPPLYNRLLRLPQNFAGLTREEGVDIEGDIRRFQAQRAGFQKSGVSQNNRLIERHASRSGYFWTSYDFSSNESRQNLFDFPLGPGGVNGFQHAGGETIFSLPNGFQAYMLNNAKGDVLDKGPTNIVRDASRKDFAVTNGISCMGCHDQGMRKAKDDVRPLVLDGKSFSKDVKDAIAALYPPSDVMDRVIEDDARRFADALTRAGIEPTLHLAGIEMINALSKRYEDDVDAISAAAELGLSKDDYAKAVADADRKFKPLLRRLAQGLVPRDQFEALFRQVADELTDDDLITVVATGEKYVEPTPTHTVDLSLISDKDAYRQGDTPSFTVLSSRDCFLTLTDVDDKGVGTVLFPNKFQNDNHIKAGREFDFPAPNAPFQYRMGDKGIETVIAVCTDRNVEVDGIKHDFSRNTVTTVPNYTASAARAITLEAKTIASNQSGSKVAPVDPPREISRAAIKLEVR